MAQDVLSDGFTRLCISTDANFYGRGCKVLVEGQMLATGAATPDKVTEVTGIREINERFGEGSILAETLRTVFRTCNTLSVFALPRQDAAGAVKATYELTITGPATSPGRFMLYWGDAEYSIDFPVDVDDTSDDIAGKLIEEIPANFPFTATSGGHGGVIRLIAKNAGTVGNGLVPIYNWTDRINIAPKGVTLSFNQIFEGSDNPWRTKEHYARELGECCYSCYILSSDDVEWQRGLRDHIRSAWDCEKPQCFGHGYVYNTGTIGQILATGDNSPEFSRMAICPNESVFPYLKNANYGALSCCKGCDNPEINIQGQDNGLLTAIRQPQTCESCWTWEEQENLKENGFVVTGPSNIGVGSYTHPYVHNDVTNYLYDDLYRENTTYRDVSSRRLAAATAISLAKELQSVNGLSLYTKNTQIPRGVMGTTIPLLTGQIRAWAKSQVGVLFSEFENLDEQLQILDDFQTMPPCQGRPGIIHLKLNYRPPVRVSQINVGLVPQLLDNCDR